jgi:hypothetical protein
MPLAAMQTSEELRKWLLGELQRQFKNRRRLIILDNAEDALDRPPANTPLDQVDSSTDAQQQAVWKLFIEVR